MKRALLVFCILFLGAGIASAAKPVVKEADNYEAFDYGARAEVVLFETKNTEWGVLGTYLNETRETTVLAGGKIYLDRILGYGKK